MAFAFYSSAFVKADPAKRTPILWSISTIIDLKIDESELVINMPYPDALGPRSFCGVEILASDLVTHQDLNKIAKDLLVRDGYGLDRGLVTLKPIKRSFGRSLAYRVASKGTYMTHIWVKAPGKKTLKEYLSKALPRSSNVFLHGIRCDDVRLK